MATAADVLLVAALVAGPAYAEAAGTLAYLAALAVGGSTFVPEVVVIANGTRAGRRTTGTIATASSDAGAAVPVPAHS